MPPPILNITESLTGRVRLRIGLFGRVKAQVEVTATSRHPLSGKAVGTTTYWRDAKPADIYAEGSLK